MKLVDMFSAVTRRAFIITLAMTLAACGGGESSAPTAGPPAEENPAVAVEIDRLSITFTGAGQSQQLTAKALDANGAPPTSPLTWVSTQPEQVTVDASGKVTSMTSIGSAMVYAEANGVRSKPTLVGMIELWPGTLQLRDANVVRSNAVTTTAADARPQVDVWLNGVAQPAVGSFVVPVETVALAGRVTEAAADGALVRVRLEATPLPELLARYDFNWTVDLNDVPLVYDQAGQSSGAQPLAKVSRAPGARAQAASTIPETGRKKLCTGEFGGKVDTTEISAKVTLNNVRAELISNKLFPTDPPNRTRMVAAGEIEFALEAGITLKAYLQAEGKCELPKAHLPIPGPAWLRAVGPAIPLSVGAKIKAEMDIASIELIFEGKSSAVFELGVDCTNPAPCRVLNSLEPKNEFKMKLKEPETRNTITDGVRVTGSVHLYFLSGLDLKPLNIVAFEMVKATFGPKQSFDFGTNNRQSIDPAYASQYDFKLAFSVGPGGSYTKALEWLKDKSTVSVDAGFEKSIDLAKSPDGPFAADKSVAIPDSDNVTFKIDIEGGSESYSLAGYNIDFVEIYRKKPGATDFSEKVRSIAASDRQTKFEWAWKPTLQDIGLNEFVAFVVPKLLPPVDISLEVKPDSRLTVNVANRGWNGTISYTVSGERTVNESGSNPGTGGSFEKTTAYRLQGSATYIVTPNGGFSPEPLLEIRDGKGDATTSRAEHLEATETSLGCRRDTVEDVNETLKGDLRQEAPTLSPGIPSQGGSYTILFTGVGGATSGTVTRVASQTATVVSGSGEGCTAGPPVNETRPVEGSFPKDVLDIGGVAEPGATSISGTRTVVRNEDGYPRRVYEIQWNFTRN